MSVSAITNPRQNGLAQNSFSSVHHHPAVAGTVASHGCHCIDPFLPSPQKSPLNKLQQPDFQFVAFSFSSNLKETTYNQSYNMHVFGMVLSPDQGWLLMIHPSVLNLWILGVSENSCWVQPNRLIGWNSPSVCRRPHLHCKLIEKRRCQKLMLQMKYHQRQADGGLQQQTLIFLALQEPHVRDVQRKPTDRSCTLTSTAATDHIVFHATQSNAEPAGRRDR
ncbi:hypothetical protein SEVIR_3G390450v4 [Setaria viridis]